MSEPTTGQRWLAFAVILGIVTEFCALAFKYPEVVLVAGLATFGCSLGLIWAVRRPNG